MTPARPPPGAANWFAGTVTRVMRCLRWLDERLSRRSRRRLGAQAPQ